MMVSVQQARDYIARLDLSYIVEAMCREDYPLPRWTHAEAEYCMQLYKNFLLLQKKHLPKSLVPTRQIDEFWHNHILHTREYMTDCDHVFGHYLHHAPAVPGKGDDALVEDFLKTKQLYLEAFGVAL